MRRAGALYTRTSSIPHWDLLVKILSSSSFGIIHYYFCVGHHSVCIDVMCLCMQEYLTSVIHCRKDALESLKVNYCTNALILLSDCAI